ncbi:glycosyltransferase [Flavobacterium sp. RSP29]|uniref:glycosyltransferase n=1 Tax=Flavobacterium sp. RSP29 TaxID=3401731 RepID=UPI003AAD5A3C
MKILFLCGSAEAGKDGVGDYSRRLAGELIRQGHQAQILSLCDKQAKSFVSQTQIIEETQVLVRRIPITSSFKQRLAWTRGIIKEEAPDWISLQFVPYSFHPKGLPFWLPRFLKNLKGEHQWQIMFHELWIGIEKSSPFKNKLIGLVQKPLIRKINNSIKPEVIHTQAKVYQHYLRKINIKANYLSLFGNVSVTATKNRNSKQLVFVVFATIHDNTPFENFIIDLKKELQGTDREIKFIFIGRNGDLLNSWTVILEKYSIAYELLGASSENKISEVLLNGNYGISSTPHKISDKSGVVAAMREHHLPIINVAKAWVDQDDISISFNDINHFQRGTFSSNKFSETVNNSLSSVCSVFLQSISNN